MDPLVHYNLKTRALADLKKIYDSNDNDDFILITDDDNETIIAVHAKLYKQEAYVPLLKFLNDFVSEAVYDIGFTVRDITTDCYDGCVLAHLLNILAGETLVEVGEPIHNISDNMAVIRKTSSILADLINNPEITETDWWNPKLINENFLPSIIIYIVVMLQYFNKEIPFFNQITMPVNFYHLDAQSNLAKKKKKVIIYDNAEFIGFISHRMKDVDLNFVNTIIEQQGVQLKNFENEILNFTTTILKKFEITVTDIYENFKSGTNFILIMQYIFDFATPLYEYFITPSSNDEINKNFKVLEELINDCAEVAEKDKIILEEMIYRENSKILWLHRKITRLALEKHPTKQFIQ